MLSLAKALAESKDPCSTFACYDASGNSTCRPSGKCPDLPPISKALQGSFDCA
jgi:hypothetical protein